MADYEYKIDELETVSTKRVTVSGHLGDLAECIGTVTGLKGVETKDDTAVVTKPKPGGLFKKSEDIPAWIIEGSKWYWDYYVLYEQDNAVTIYRMPGKREELVQEHNAELEKAQSDYDNASTFKKVLASASLKVAQASLSEYTDPQDIGAENNFCDAIEYTVSDFGTGWYYNDDRRVSAPAQWQSNGAPAAAAAAPAPAQPAAAPAAGGFCGNCGAPIKPGSKFCASCGAKL